MTSIQYLTEEQAKAFVRNQVCDDLIFPAEELEVESHLLPEDKDRIHGLIERVRQRMVEREKR